MENQMIPSYSGVTINITNPTVNAGAKCDYNPSSVPQNINQTQHQMYSQPQPIVTNPNEIVQLPQVNGQPNISAENNSLQQVVTNPQQTYPPQYYMNNYNIQQPSASPAQYLQDKSGQFVAPQIQNTKDIQGQDLSSSKEIINELNSRSEEQKELEKNGKKTKVVALTNEYIMSLENYLNNPNTEIRLMASKEILTRLDEDKDRYNDAALNALLNKMLQDPEKLVRIAALSAFSSGLASGNDYTVQLLNKIQQDPNSDKEDVVDAANILLKMSASTEVKYVPNKNPQDEQKVEQ